MAGKVFQRGHTAYSHLFNNRGGWNKCGGWNKHGGWNKRGGWNFLEKTST